MKFLTSSQGLSMKGYAAIRMAAGILLIYHGYEVFNPETMSGYGKWLGELHFPMPLLAGYVGKGAEFVCGILLLTGFLTRVASILLIGTMCGIAFGMGHGKIFTDDQHPFLFVLLGLIFLFVGSGPWSLDNRKKS